MFMRLIQAIPVAVLSINTSPARRDTLRGVMKTDYRNRSLALLHWMARALVAGVFLLWGAFFVEHMHEWFIAPFPHRPPLKVCFGQALHFLLLVGLLVSLRWPRVGAGWVVVAAFAFFIDKTGARFPLFFGLTVLPSLLLLFCGWLDQKHVRPNKDANASRERL
jgi:hypothetical protein